jgi:PAS domain S-box-containing protein
MAQDIRGHSIFLRYSAVASRWLASAGLALTIGLAYFLAARLSLAWLSFDGVAVFWPSAGVSAGALIALGRDARWPVISGVIVATLAANLLGDRNLWSAITFGICNAGEAVLAAALIARRFGQSFDLDSLSHVLGLVMAAVAATAVSGIGGTLGFVWFYGSTAPLATIWFSWFASDALGIVAVAPLLIGFASIQRHAPSPKEWAEAVVALVLFTLANALGILLSSQAWAISIPIALLFPIFLWLAARCSPIFAAAAAFIAVIAIECKATFGLGLFGNLSLDASGRILVAQAGVLAVSFSALVPAALFAERRAHGLALEQSAQRWRLAVTASGMGMFDWDLRTGIVLWSDEWYRMLGYRVGEVEPSRAAWIDRIHPDDRQKVFAAYKRRDSQPQEFSCDYRIVRRDGDLRWIRTHARYLHEGGKPVRLLGLEQDITEARQQVETQRVLVAELQHRTRNLMAVVQSIADQTLEKANSLADFQNRFNRRLEALSRVQSLLSRADNEPITLRALLVMEFDALGLDLLSKVSRFGGPEVPLRKSAVEMLALAIHELLTNAIKYGAFASETGRLSVTWRIEGMLPDRQLVLEWIERGITSPALPSDPRRNGYGRTLIEEALPYSLSAETTFELGPDGLLCRICLPLGPSDAGEAAA